MQALTTNRVSNKRPYRKVQRKGKARPLAEGHKGQAVAILHESPKSGGTATIKNVDKIPTIRVVREIEDKDKLAPHVRNKFCDSKRERIGMSKGCKRGV